jgi:hypothetical protein
MRIIGWLASAVGVSGVVVCNWVAPLLWVLRHSLRARAQDLLAIPDAGLGVAITVTDTASSWLGEAAASVDAIKVQADRVAQGPVTDAAVADLASAIDAFVTGPYGTLRTVYAGLRERAISVGEAIEGMSRAVPLLSAAAAVTDRLQAIDARLLEVDASVMHLAQMGPAGLAEPGVAATVSERAVGVEEHIAAITEQVAEVDAWLHESRERVAKADRRTGRVLTLGAIGGTALTLFVAGLNILLFQQGRRWSRRG